MPLNNKIKIHRQYCKTAKQKITECNNKWQIENRAREASKNAKWAPQKQAKEAQMTKIHWKQMQTKVS